jgi:hypothetical protein
MKGRRESVRDRMVRSLVESEQAAGSDRFALYMLLQNCEADKVPALAGAMPDFFHPVAIPHRVPLSTARNILLRRLIADDAIRADALVAFPDDDCWYPPGLLVHVAGLFTGNAELDFWFCRYASNPSVLTQDTSRATLPLDLRAARMAEIVRNASSNTIFMRGRVINAIGDFDEGLGVGTPLGGAEDLDYVLRAHRVARKTSYCDAALVGHRDKSRELLARYYASSLVVLARHARTGAASEFYRKIAVGIYYALRRRLSIADYGRALRLAFAAHRKPPSAAALNPER